MRIANIAFMTSSAVSIDTRRLFQGQQVRRQNRRNGDCKRGLIKLRKREVHQSTDALLTVPQYRDVVQAQDDETAGPRVPAVVSTAAGWRAVMNKWVADAQAAAADEDADTVADDAEDVGDKARRSKWKKRTLAELFGGAEKKHATRLTQEEIDAEAELMKGLAEVEAQAEAEEDARLDDGAVEIASEDEYMD